MRFSFTFLDLYLQFINQAFILVGFWIKRHELVATIKTLVKCISVNCRFLILFKVTNY